MSEQDRMYLRHLYAMFAMQKMNWRVGDDKTDAEDCFRIADAMLEASESKPVEEGIVSIKKRRSKQ
jgi:hypothetical protein